MDRMLAISMKPGTIVPRFNVKVTKVRQQSNGLARSDRPNKENTLNNRKSR
jgi:hypothetical protein